MVARMIRTGLQLSVGKMTRALLLLTAALVVLTLTSSSTYAQFLPCNIVNLTVVPPTLIQAGQPFQVTTNLTVSCDPRVLPVIRVDLLDATTFQTLSTNSVAYLPFSSSFPASVANRATARELTGSWALQVQAYVISGLNGRALASTGQLFQVNVQPYTPPVTEMQTTEMSTEISNSPVAATAQLLPATTALGNATETTMSSELVISTQAISIPAGELLVPVAILLVGFVVFGLLIFAGRRRGLRTPSSEHRG